MKINQKITFGIITAISLVAINFWSNSEKIESQNLKSSVPNLSTLSSGLTSKGIGIAKNSVSGIDTSSITSNLSLNSLKNGGVSNITSAIKDEASGAVSRFGKQVKKEAITAGKQVAENAKNKALEAGNAAIENAKTQAIEKVTNLLPGGMVGGMAAGAVGSAVSGVSLTSLLPGGKAGSGGATAAISSLKNAAGEQIAAGTETAKNLSASITGAIYSGDSPTIASEFSNLLPDGPNAETIAKVNLPEVPKVTAGGNSNPVPSASIPASLANISVPSPSGGSKSLLSAQNQAIKIAQDPSSGFAAEEVTVYDEDGNSKTAKVLYTKLVGSGSNDDN